MVVGEAGTMGELDLASFPVTWEELPPLTTVDEAARDGAPTLHAARGGNVLIRGNVQRGDLAGRSATPRSRSRGTSRPGSSSTPTSSRRPGSAERIGDRVEVRVTTQSPHMDREELAAILGLPAGGGPDPADRGRGRVREQARPVGAAVPGARRVGARPPGPHHVHAPRVDDVDHEAPPFADAGRGSGRPRDGRLVAMDFSGEFNTGAYASWGATVANRVPVHAGGPYRLRRLPRADGRRAHERAARGCVPRVRRAAVDDRDRVPARRARRRGGGRPARVPAAERARRRSADGDRPGLRRGHGLPRVPGGAPAALAAGPPRRGGFNADASGPAGPDARGVGLAGMWYGCGNTALPNPSTIKVGLRRDGRIVLFQGAVDMGQGANTVMTQICADAVGVGLARSVTLGADTDTTPDAGKSSASRQTFISGNATYLAGTRAPRAPAGARGRLRRGAPGARRRPPHRPRPRAKPDRGPGRARDRRRRAGGRGGTRHLRPSHHRARRGRAGRPRTRSSGSARTSPSSRSTSSSGPSTCSGSPPRTTSAGP